MRTSKFCQELHEHVYGRNAGKRSFVHSTRAAHRQFKRKIRSTMPDFRPFVHWTDYRRPEDPISATGGAKNDGGRANIQLIGPTMGLLDVNQIIKE